MIGVALTSYGMSGHVFHAPFMHLNPGFTLKGSWERSKKQIQLDYPGTRSYSSLEELLSDKEVQLVVVNTPNVTHFEYAKRSLESGKHVIIEKPFTTTSAEAEHLSGLAKEKKRVLSIYHNRRWDSDFKTTQKIINDGVLGKIVEAEIHFDRFNLNLSPKAHKELDSGGTGVLHDLGSHIIDQALCLFGKPEAVFADLRILRPGSVVNDYMDVLLYYPELRVRLKSTYVAKEYGAGFTIHGTNGSFIKSRADVQEDDLKKGLRPENAHWGWEPESENGLLNFIEDGSTFRERIPTLHGNYMDYYNGIFNAVVKNTDPPVTAEDGLLVMKVIDAALESDSKRKVISIK
jgi:scyllo-inositol 2-dehydrogenase (NADP+)